MPADMGSSDERNKGLLTLSTAWITVSTIMAAVLKQSIHPKTRSPVEAQRLHEVVSIVPRRTSRDLRIGSPGVLGGMLILERACYVVIQVCPYGDIDAGCVSNLLIKEVKSLVMSIVRAQFAR
jgi:hypothetical protein